MASDSAHPEGILFVQQDISIQEAISLFQSGLLCPCKLNFMYVCVCVYTSQFILYIYFYDLYSPVSSFF